MKIEGRAQPAHFDDWEWEDEIDLPFEQVLKPLFKKNAALTINEFVDTLRTYACGDAPGKLELLGYTDEPLVAEPTITMTIDLEEELLLLVDITDDDEVDGWVAWLRKTADQIEGTRAVVQKKSQTRNVRRSKK